MAESKPSNGPRRSGRDREYPAIGWREWVSLPELNIAEIKAKVDTGARSSSLHAMRVKVFTSGGKRRVRFFVHPLQRNSKVTIEVESDILEFRNVKSSSGEVSKRPVILTTVCVLGRTFPIELTLAGRESMGFRMLLGREAIRGRFLVDAGRSYYGDKAKLA